MKNTLNENDYAQVADVLGVEKAAVKAVVEVESGNRRGFIEDGRPLILFEGHVFWQRLKLYGLNPVNFIRGNEDIVHLEWTRRHYKGGTREYERLERAMKIHERAALESTSWGVFQIMGFNHKLCGCDTVQEFVDIMNSGIGEQLMLWCEFMKNTGLAYCLRYHKWALFALRYNGKGYKANKYDKRIKKAYEKHKRNEKTED